MRQIGSIPLEHQARIFGDYLLARGIANQVEEGSSGWDVWVHRDEQLDAARSELAAYVQNISSPTYLEAAASAQHLRKQEIAQETQLRKKFIDVRTTWATAPIGSRPLTIALIAISCIVFLVMSIQRHDPVHMVVNPLRITPLKMVDENSYTWGGLEEIRHGQVWRVVTPIFIHFGILHLVFNMFWLVDLGTLIEARRGTFFLLMLVLVSAVIPNLAQYFYSQHHNPNFGGMSGVVYALFGYVWMKGRLDPTSGMGVHPNTVYYMIGWLLLCMTGLVGDIANTAHLVGLAVGVGIGSAPYYWRRQLRRK